MIGYLRRQMFKRCPEHMLGRWVRFEEALGGKRRLFGQRFRGGNRLWLRGKRPERIEGMTGVHPILAFGHRESAGEQITRWPWALLRLGHRSGGVVPNRRTSMLRGTGLREPGGGLRLCLRACCCLRRRGAGCVGLQLGCARLVGSPAAQNARRTTNKRKKLARRLTKLSQPVLGASACDGYQQQSEQLEAGNLSVFAVHDRPNHRRQVVLKRARDGDRRRQRTDILR